MTRHLLDLAASLVYGSMQTDLRKLNVIFFQACLHLLICTIKSSILFCQMLEIFRVWYFRHLCCMSTLTSIDDGAFTHVGSLKELHLHSNKLQQPALDFRLNFLPRLYYLRLDHNDIATLSTSAFGGLSALLYLNLSSNSLSSLSDDVFDGLSSLQSLGLGRNSLSNFPPMEAFETTLTNLDMRFNSLTEVPPNTFKDMSGLTTIHLEGNMISTISDDSFSGPTSLRTLLVNGLFPEQLI
jgi:hypothetical protein